MSRYEDHSRANLPVLPDEETYYVYGFFDGEHLFYVGKGREYRYARHFDEYYLKDNTPKINKIKKINNEGRKVDVRFFAVHLTEHEALLLEKSLIESYGVWDDGGQLTNLRYGSLDSAGIWTTKRKEEHSVRMRGKNGKVDEHLVVRAKLLVHYMDYTVEEVSNLPEYSCVSRQTIKNWCNKRKYKYLMPHLKSRRELSEEKKHECYNLWIKGQFTQQQVADIFGLEYGTVKWYISERTRELSKGAINASTTSL